MENEKIEKIEIRSKPNCRNCLGSGMAHGRYAGVTYVCPCVTEQLRIIITAKNYTIPQAERYTPGQAEMVMEAERGDGGDNRDI